jgi:catechol 2,3-dioxygenase-like lactoylglutathione lyase family enzyme
LTIRRLEHGGIVVEDLATATEFFVELGLTLLGDGPVEGGRADRVAMLEPSDGHARLALTTFHAPSGRGGDRHAPANTPGIRHVPLAL